MNSPSIRSIIDEAARQATDAGGVLRLTQFADAVVAEREAVMQRGTHVRRGLNKIAHHVRRVMLDAGFSGRDVTQFWSDCP